MRSVTYVIVTALAFALTTGLSIAGDSARHKDCVPLEIDGLAEPILGLNYDEKGIEFQVRSTGCTEKSDFAMQRLSPESQTTSQVLLIRVEPDFCDAWVPFGVRISYSYEELGLEEGEFFTVLNPLSNYRVVLFD